MLAIEVVGADHAERAFDELAVAGFALAEGGFGDALDGDVDAGGDDEADLALVCRAARWRTRRCGGGVPSRLSQWFSKVAGKLPARRRSKVSMASGMSSAGDELVPGVAADEGGEVVAGGGLAGAVEADDAAGGVEDDDQGADGVEDGGDEVALDGEGGFDALAGAGGAVHLADAAVELEAGDDLAAEDVEGVGLRGGERRGAARSRTKSAPMLTAVGSGEGSAGVEAEDAAVEVGCRRGRSRGRGGRRGSRRRCRRGWWSRRAEWRAGLR